MALANMPIDPTVCRFSIFLGKGIENVLCYYMCNRGLGNPFTEAITCKKMGLNGKPLCQSTTCCLHILSVQRRVAKLFAMQQFMQHVSFHLAKQDKKQLFRVQGSRFAGSLYGLASQFPGSPTHRSDTHLAIGANTRTTPNRERNPKPFRSTQATTTLRSE
jgi:hypothetical protein